MSQRYVILHHLLPGDEHWDFMLEHGNTLLTWRIPRDPTLPGEWPIRCERIGDHRKAYLDYEGPVSGDRGVVTRVDRGPLELEAVEEQRVVFVTGGRFQGRHVFQRSGVEWFLRPA